jgi:hypothetical protein
MTPTPVDLVQQMVRHDERVPAATLPAGAAPLGRYRGG